MHRPLILCLAISLLTANLYGQDAKKPSPVVKKILDKAVGEVQKNRQVFDIANEKPLAEARKALEDQAKKLIEDSYADEATAILGHVKTLETDVMKMANATAPVGGGGKPAPQKPLSVRITGRWLNGNHDHAFLIEPNGAITEVLKRNGQVISRGRIMNISDDVGEVRLENGYKCQMGLVGDDLLAMVWWEPSGKPLPGWFFERTK